MQTAVSAVRTRLESKARGSVAAAAGTVVFPDLVQITYKDEPSTPEAGGGVRIHQSAHVVAPVFPADALAQTVYADANGASITFTPGSGFVAFRCRPIAVRACRLGAARVEYRFRGSTAGSCRQGPRRVSDYSHPVLRRARGARTHRTILEKHVPDQPCRHQD